MDLLLCDGPANGRFADVQLASCPKGHEVKLDPSLDNGCPHPDADEVVCSLPLYFAIEGGTYSFEPWVKNSDEFTEFVGIWTPNQEVTTT